MDDIQGFRRLHRPASPELPPFTGKDDDKDSGLITSDSDFEEAVRQARNRTTMDVHNYSSQNELGPKEQRANVSRTFKRMLS